MNLIHPKQLLEEKRKEEERKTKVGLNCLSEYLDKNPPELIDFTYHIKYTADLREVLFSIDPNNAIFENAMATINDFVNKGFRDDKGYMFECRYMLYDSDCVLILTPINRI